MSDQTRYEVGDLWASKGCYGEPKKLLSAAMTNENCCIDGSFEFDELDPANYITFVSRHSHLYAFVCWSLHNFSHVNCDFLYIEPLSQIQGLIFYMSISER